MGLIDLHDQKIRRNEEEMLKHLRSFRLEPRFSIGVWYFYPSGGRFHEPYIERGTIHDVLRKVSMMYDRGIIDSSFGLETHYPNEVNYELLDAYKSLQRETGIRLITVVPNLFL